VKSTEVLRGIHVQNLTTSHGVKYYVHSYIHSEGQELGVIKAGFQVSLIFCTLNFSFSTDLANVQTVRNMLEKLLVVPRPID
jgi:hypothetical protein